ncbi:FxsA family protein [Streptomyces capparidis]
MTSPSAPQAPYARPRRSRARTVAPLVLAAWVVLEIWLLMVVADATSGLLVLLLLLAGFVVGGAAVRRAGARAWRNLTEAVRSGATTAPESSGAALAMLGGFLLMLPGFASDAVGLLLLFPPTRALLKGLLPRGLTAHRGPVGTAYQQARIHRPDGKVVQGEVVDRDDEAQG